MCAYYVCLLCLLTMCAYYVCKLCVLTMCADISLDFWEDGHVRDGLIEVGIIFVSSVFRSRGASVTKVALVQAFDEKAWRYKQRYKQKRGRLHG